MKSTRWDKIEERRERSEKALKYMSEHPLSLQEAREQAERLRRMSDER